MSGKPDTTPADLAARLAALSPEKQALLAKKLAGRSASRGPDAEQIAPRGTVEPAPLSHVQELLWLYEQMTPGTDAYNMPMTRRIRGLLDLPALQRAFDQVVARHESLRTRFIDVGGAPRQVVDAPAPVTIEVHDLRARPAAGREAEALDILRSAAALPFDLARGTAPRIELVRLADDDAILLIVVHHIVFDGGSVGVLFRELALAYDAARAGTEAQFPSLPIQLADYAMWERTTLDDARLAPSLNFWRSYLDGSQAAIDLPADFPRPSGPMGPAGRHVAVFPVEAHDAVTALAASNHVTPFIVLLGAFQSVLRRYSSQRDITVGTTLAGRSRPGTQGLVGYLANTLPIRARFDDATTIGDLLTQLHEGVSAAFDHADVPYERLVRDVRAGLPVNEQALFRVMFTLQDAAGTPARLGAATLEPLGIELGAAKFDITVSAVEIAQGFRLVVDYRSDLFRPDTIDRLITHLRELLLAAARAPSTPVAHLQFLTLAERRRLLEELNDTDAAWPTDATVHGLFAAQVRRRPDAIAIECGSERLTYVELDRQANRLAWRLRARGVGPDTLVAVCMEKSADVIPVLLGILKAGGAYLPIDPGYPDGRVAFMLADSGVRIVVTDGALVKRASVPGVEALLATALWADAPPGDPARDEEPPPVAGPGNLCYVIYTSGSTGQPKGALIEHRNVVRLFVNDRFQFAFDETDVWTVFHSFAFDFSVWEMYGALLFGGRVVVVPREIAQDPGAYLDLLERQRVTVLNQVPSAFYGLMRHELARPTAALALRYVIFGGEALQPALLREWRARYPATKLINMFGITETTVHVTFKEIGDREIDDGASNIGRPIPTLTTYVLDEYLQLLPFGASGELCVGGAGVARGYLNRPELTAERFVPHPFRTGERMYRSGDLGRLRITGEIEYLGRRDAQVKLRGFRIELGEIEAAVAALQGIQAVAVILRPDAAGEPRLLGYVVLEPGSEASPPQMRTALRERLPDYMVPAVMTVLDALPITSNGKVDRAALPDPAATTSQREFVAPTTPTEIAVAAAFAEVLHVERVGTRDDFYDLGGHSLLAMRLAGRLSELCRALVPVRSVFEYPRVGDLAASIDRGPARGAHGPRQAIVPAPRERRSASSLGLGDQLGDVTVFPASFAQRRLFFLEELDPGGSTYNVPLAARLHGALDVGALQATIDGIVARHEALRTTFAIENDRPVQVIRPPASVPIGLHDFAGTADAESLAWAALRSEANQPFDLRHGPIVRAALFRVAADDHLMLITLHHIAADGWSVGTLQRELGAGYGLAHGVHSSPMFPPPVQYADYTLWQRAQLEGESLAGLESYWRTQLAGSLPVLELPMRTSRPAALGARPVQRVAFPISASMAAQLGVLARDERATPFMVLLAAFQTLLSRYSNQTDVIVGTPMSGRDAPELESVVGLFLNTVALRTNLADNPTFRTLIGRVRETTLSAFAHAALPFERVIDVVNPPRNAAMTPIFQVMFSMQNATAAATSGGPVDLTLPGLRVERVGAALESTKYGLQLTLVPDGAAYRGTLEFDASLFDAELVARLGAHLRNLLAAIGDDPDRRIGDLPLLGAPERDRIVGDWNATQLDYPRDRDLVALFDAQIARTPDAVAVRCESDALTYGALDEQVMHLASYLRGLGVGPEVVVGLYVERSLDMVVALLAILRAGGAYLPLDPSYPRERLEFMVADSGAAVVITEQALRDRIALGTARIVSIDGDREAISAAPTTTGVTGAVGDPQRLAYLIYTSGSTGKPKGVAVTHRNVVNFLYGFAAKVPLRPEHALVAVTPLSFDIAGLELFLPLISGARLVVASRDTAQSATALATLLTDSGATHMQATPATWRMLVGSGWSRHGGLVALCGGEALQPMLARDLVARDLELWNLYGPTEATIWATMFRVDAAALEHGAASQGGPVAIGTPMANARAYVLDSNGNPTPIGVAGELFLGGDGIARGYHNRPELTAQRFVPDPFARAAGARMYRTGDRAVWRADGVLEFLGRFDDQIKLRGFRIELGEIESVLAAQPEVESAVVLVREDVPGDQRLVAYCVGEDESSARPTVAAGLSATMRERLKDVLPAYMMPSAFVWLDAWPLTPNGKLDRKALPAPDSSAAAGAGRPFQPPENAIEEIVAGVWKDVLRAERVSVDADFFDLGGHSLLAMQAVSTLSRMFSRPITLKSFFAHSTIRGFGTVLGADEPTPGRTLAVARALVRLRDMSPEERDARRQARPTDR